MKRISPVLAILAALVLPACEPQSSFGPSAEQKSQTRLADSGSDAAAQTVKIGGDAVIDSGSQNAAARTTANARAGSPRLASVDAFSYAAAVDVTIDLNALDGEGVDPFPNASGVIRIQAAGAIEGSGTAGNAVYAVQTQWLTDGEFVDPASGAKVTLAQGSGLSWALTFSWNWIAADNWTVSGTNSYEGSHVVTVEHEGQSWTAACQSERHAGVVYSRTPAGEAASGAVSGHLEAVLTGPEGVHTVSIDWFGAAKVEITTDGVVHGPYTVAVANAVFGCEIN